MRRLNLHWLTFRPNASFECGDVARSGGGGGGEVRCVLNVVDALRK